MHGTARCFDLRPQRQQATGGGTSSRSNDGTRPGDLFNQGHTCAEILQAHGWIEGRRTTAGMGMTRPGKSSGVSGVILEQTKNFFCWSSNAFPLEAGRSYSAFGLLAAFEHNGDFQAAARALGAEGYGDPARKPGGQQAPDAWPEPKPLTAKIRPEK